VAIVTPWNKGDGYLPRKDDLARLIGITKRVYLTAMPALRRVRKDATVEKLIRQLHGDRIRELRGWGHVRARRRPGESEWRVEVSGDAVAIDP
jgi:hypothetical protein